MATIIPASEIMSDLGGGLYLSAEDKARLHTEQAPFWITGAVGEQDGQYGPQTVFSIREKNGNESRLAFGVSEARKEMAKKISVAIAQGADAVGPFYLGRWENGNRSGWTLTPEPTKVMEIPPSPAAKEAAERELKRAVYESKIGGDEDIPFAPSYL